MGTSNLDQIVLNTPDPKLSNSQAHQCSSLSSIQTLNALENDNHSSQENETNIKGNKNSAFCALKIHVPTLTDELRVRNDYYNDPKTPTSKEHRIPITNTCPPAPRKARRVTMNGKRKAAYFPNIGAPAEFMVYVDTMLAFNEAIYVPDIVVGDLLGQGDNAKRLKPLPRSPAHEL